jgi:hypothetical protein
MYLRLSNECKYREEMKILDLNKILFGTWLFHSCCVYQFMFTFKWLKQNILVSGNEIPQSISRK